MVACKPPHASKPTPGIAFAGPRLKGRSFSPVMRITVEENHLRYSCDHTMRGDGTLLQQRETQMNEHSNRKQEELNDRELDAVCGGFYNDGGCIGPWIVNGQITTHQPMGPNPWLPGGIFHR